MVSPLVVEADDDRDETALNSVAVVPTEGADVPRPKAHAAEPVPVGGETPCQLDGLLLLLAVPFNTLGKSVATDWDVR